MKVRFVLAAGRKKRCYRRDAASFFPVPSLTNDNFEDFGVRSEGIAGNNVDRTHKEFTVSAFFFVT